MVKENLAQVEEVRELENQSQEQESTITESAKEAVLPTVHASSEDEKTKESLKEAQSGAIIGSGTAVGIATLNLSTGLATGGTMAGTLKGLGKIEKGIGKITDNKDIERMGEVHDEGSTRAIEDLGKKISE